MTLAGPAADITAAMADFMAGVVPGVPARRVLRAAHPMAAVLAPAPVWAGLVRPAAAALAARAVAWVAVPAASAAWAAAEAMAAVAAAAGKKHSDRENCCKAIGLRQFSFCVFIVKEIHLTKQLC